MRAFYTAVDHLHVEGRWSGHVDPVDDLAADLLPAITPVRMPVFTINDEAYPNITPATGAMNAIEVWEIHNMSPMDHPFHLHGMEFQLVAAGSDTSTCPDSQSRSAA
jgi:FtsP/CotA-like multicopper oxidase with cupredoxin domain